MIIDGKQLAKEIMERVSERVQSLEAPPTLYIVVVGANPVVDTFVAIKERYALRAGITTMVHRYDDHISHNELLLVIDGIVNMCIHKGDGILIQLPLPQHINSKEILNRVPLRHDVDMLSQTAQTAFTKGLTTTMPPVAGAVWKALSSCPKIAHDSLIVVVGRGMLVGIPVTELLRQHGYAPAVIDKDTAPELRQRLLQCADVIVCGAGDPWFLLPEQIKEGVILIDAGTSESENSVKGDVHPDCYQKASRYTPVPGGIGPLTVASVFDNMCTLLD